MKFKEILLDFTSLLDVIMIILFWFILNYHNQTVAIQEQANQKINEAESIVAEVDEKKAELAEKEQDLLDQQSEIESMLAEIKDADERKGANIAGLNEFQKGINLTVRLERENNGQFILLIYKGNDLDSEMADEEVPLSDFNTERFSMIIRNYDYEEDDAVLLELVYNNEEIGSNKAVGTIDEVLEEIKEEYPYLYVRKLKIS